VKIFVVHIIDDPVPVELSNFIATANLNNVNISWTTLTETNNSGFEIERASSLPDGKAGSTTPGDDVWEKIGYVPGFGTSTEIRSYTYNDSNLDDGIYSYRLKQIDYDGSFDYSDVINIGVSVPGEFVLEQNYPNPFNPTTNINFRIADLGFVSLKVYDVLGNEVATLVDEYRAAGEYEVEFSSSVLQQISSGMYIYQLSAGNFTKTMKMVLLK